MKFFRNLATRLGLGDECQPEPLDPAAVAIAYARLPEDVQLRLTKEILAAQRAAGPEPVRDREVRGRLVFEHNGPEGPVPFHHGRVEVWDRDFGGTGDCLGATESDLDGRFSVMYASDAAGAGDLPDLELRIYVPHHRFTGPGKWVDEWELASRIRGPDDVDGAFDFGEVRVAWWEYDAVSPIPRLQVQEHGTPPEQYPASRSVAMLQAVAPVELHKRRHLARVRDGESLDIETIQADYPDTLTRRLERDEPGRTRGARYLGERLLTGMYSMPFDRDSEAPDAPDRYRIYHPWNAYEQDGEHILPELDLRLQLVDGAMLPVRIGLGFREEGARAPRSPLQWRWFEPDHGESWAHALRLVRTSLSLDAALGNHLGACHLNVEQYTLAARRNLRRSPVRVLLMPHIREVSLVNHSADAFLIGPSGYITRASGLSDRGLNQRLVHLMGSYDWKGFFPSPALCPEHTFARAAAIMWDLIHTHVARVVDERRADITATWPEIHRFSRDLVAHAAPRFTCSFVRREWKGGAPPWMAPSERPNLGAPPGTAAVSPLTLTDAPAEGEVEALIQLVTYVIFFATFRHAWANNLQWDDAGEVLYANLGMRPGATGGLGPESDERLAPTPEHATEMLWISWMLSRTAAGLLVDNDEADVDPRFVSELRGRRSELEALGLHLDGLGSRINI